MYQRVKILASLQVVLREEEWEFIRASLPLENDAIAGDELEHPSSSGTKLRSLKVVTTGYRSHEK
jgi:hypothetical protein